MEKQQLLPQQESDLPSTSPAHRRRHQVRKVSFARTFVLLVCITYFFIHLAPYVAKRTLSPPPGHNNDADPADHFSWHKLQWSPELKWSPCYDGEFQCARLEVPMDYWNGTTDAKVGLAVIKKPAIVPVTDARYGGPILLNPGGPGGSGVQFLRRIAGDIRRTFEPDLDDEEAAKAAKHFDLISFDPRGVAWSEPRVQCFQEEVLSHIWQVRVMEEGVFGSSDAAFGRLWSMSAAKGGSCSLPVEGPDIKQYVSTASVARDMVSIIEAHGRWREAEAMRLLGCRSKIASHLKHTPGLEKLQYAGFSYGTYLGMTFAAMFPEKSHRVMVDGVVDAYDYRKTLWYDNLVDTERDVDSFYYHCARVGYPVCRLANSTGNSTADGVKNRTMDILQSLYHNPLPVIGSEPEIVSYSDVKNLIFGALYSPLQMFPFLANVLADIEVGDGTVIAALLKVYHNFHCPNSSQSTGFGPPFPLRNQSQQEDIPPSNDAEPLIACTDGDSQANFTREDFRKYMRKEEKLSPSIGEMWATLRLSCVHHTTRAQHRFTAPWVSNTSHPLLFVGNTADPVTPVGSARKMSKDFAGSVVLTVDGPGHCSISARSECAKGWIRHFFQTGGLPPKGIVCDPDVLPFGGQAAVDAAQDTESNASLVTVQDDLSMALLEANPFLTRSNVGRAIVERWRWGQ